MALDDLRLAIRRHPRALAAILIAVTAFVAVRLGDRPVAEPVAATKVLILPDPRAPISTATPVLPAYETFGTKLGSIESGLVLRRAGEIALGLAEFRSSEFAAERLRARVAEGIAAQRARWGTDSDARDALATDLAERVSAHHIARKQIVEVRVRDRSADEAVFLSWAVAEAAHQLHGERMRRETDAVRARLLAEIEAARADLAAPEESPGAPAESQLEIEGRILAESAGRLGEDEVRLEFALARNRLGLPPPGFEPAPAPAVVRERDRLAQFLGVQKLELFLRALLLTPRHPEIRRRQAEVHVLAAQLGRMEEAFAALAERRLAGALASERRALAVEAEILDDRRAWLSARAGGWLRELARKRKDDDETARRHERVSSLVSLERQVRWFGEALGSPVVLLSPAMGASLPPPPVLPGLMLAIGAALAIAAALGGLVAAERLHDRVRGCRDVEERLGVPLLGVIPMERRLPVDLLEDHGSGAAGAGIDALAAALCDSAGAARRRVVALASARSGEGRTTIAIRLAATLARRGRKVVLVDGDLRSPSIAAQLGKPPAVGLNCCTIGAPAESAEEELLYETSLPSLDVLPSAPLPPDVLPILEATRLGGLIGALAARYDHVIIDTPALARAGDALSIASAVDGVILVAASHHTPLAEVAEALRTLRAAGGNVIGAVLSRFPSAPAAAFSRRVEAEEPIEPTEQTASARGRRLVPG